MPRTKSSPVKLSSWGGKRNGAGRRRVLSIWDRKEIAQDYFDKMQSHRKTTSERRPRREVVCELMAEFDVTHRMVERCVAEFVPDIRSNSGLYAYAIEGMNEIQPLPKQKIEKLKPGAYTENRLRLVIDSAGNRKWIFPFIWRYTIRNMVLGGSELSLATARERATKASQTLAAGQNPIDGSWSGAILQTVKSKS